MQRQFYHQQTGENHSLDNELGSTSSRYCIWIADGTLSGVFDISSQSKQKLRRKRRSENVKIYAN